MGGKGVQRPQNSMRTAHTATDLHHPNVVAVCTTSNTTKRTPREGPAVTLLDTHPYRFGWRLWYALPRIARLVTPVEAIMLAGDTLDARCETGHTAPVLACTCGVHYWPDIHITDAYNHNDPPLALTFGVALGPIAPDRVDTLGALRSRRYRILAMFLPAELEPIADRFSSHQGVPVFAGISESHCRATAAAAVPNREPDWFDELAAQPKPEPDAATRRYNDAITAIRQLRRPFDASSTEHIQAMFESDARRVDDLAGGLL